MSIFRLKYFFVFRFLRNEAAFFIEPCRTFVECPAVEFDGDATAAAGVVLRRAHKRACRLPAATLFGYAEIVYIQPLARLVRLVRRSFADAAYSLSAYISVLFRDERKVL